MNNSNIVIKRKAICGHEVAVTISETTLSDLYKASSNFVICAIENAISTASCPVCVFFEATRNR